MIMDKKMYKIDFAKKTVSLTKAFRDEAQDITSEAYSLIRKFEKDGFTILNRTHAPAKSTKPAPTIAQMKRYIALVENSEAYQAEFETVREEAETHKNSYARIRAWFNKTFPCYAKAVEFNDEGKVVVLPAEHNKTALKIA